MKGVIINLFEKYVEEKYGDVFLEEIYDNAEISAGVPPFVGPLSYPDTDISNMVDYLSAKKEKKLNEIFYDFGKFCVPVLAKRYPGFFEQVSNTTELLKTVNDIHNLEVKKLYDNVKLPVINIDKKRDGLTVHYISDLKFCDFLKGLIEGVAHFFKEKISYEEIQCMKDGNDECTFKISFIKE